MEFVIAKKDFDSAVKQILVGREATSMEPVDLTVDESSLKLEAMGTDVEVPVETKTPGVARVSISNIAGLKKISRTYKTGPINVRVADGYIRFQRTSIRINLPETKNTRRMIDIPSDARAMDLIALQEIFSAEEIEESGLLPKVLETQDMKARTLEAAATSLQKYGFTWSELSSMAETKLKAHATIMRRVLFPDEDPPASSEDQDVETEGDNDEETTVGGKQMSESQMRAELDRLRAENAQLKSKDKGGISLKVSEKGAISLYGMGRFPVTLYKEQWLRVLASAAEIEKFIRDNESKLKTKD
jgi:hypothetical protein